MAANEFLLDPVKLDLAKVRGIGNRLTENRGLGFKLKEPSFPDPKTTDWGKIRNGLKTSKWDNILNFLGPKPKELPRNESILNDIKALDQRTGNIDLKVAPGEHIGNLPINLLKLFSK